MKRLLEEYETRGFGSVGREYVCDQCIIEPLVKLFIQANRQAGPPRRPETRGPASRQRRYFVPILGDFVRDVARPIERGHKDTRAI